eukprot:269546_1
MAQVQESSSSGRRSNRLRKSMPLPSSSSAAPDDLTQTPRSGRKSMSAIGKAVVAAEFLQSPLRSERLEEKNQMQKLNHRLEFLIMRNREKDRKQTELERSVIKAKERSNVEINRIRDECNKEIERLRSERDACEAARLEASSEMGPMKREVELLKENVKKQKELSQATQKKNDQLTKLNHKKDLRIETLEAQLEENKVDLATVRRAAQRYQTDAERTEKQLSKTNSILNKAQQSARDVERVEAQLQERINEKNAEIEKLSKAREQFEKGLHDQYNNQLKDILKKRQDQYEDEKEKEVQAIHADNEEKIVAMRQKLSELGNALDERDQELNEAAVKVQDAERFALKWTTEKDSFVKRIEVLEQDLDAEKARPKRELESKMKIIKRMKESFTRKEAEFDSLMDVKIALNAEIDAYRLMLDNEETRLEVGLLVGEDSQPSGAVKAGKDLVAGLKKALSGGQKALGGGGRKANPRSRSRKKRKLADMEGSEDAAPEFPEISEIDLDRGFILIANHTEHSVSLKGWHIANAQKKHVFAFKARQKLKTGEEMRLYANQTKAMNSSHANAIMYDAENFDVEGGDKVMLVSPVGDVVSEMEILGSSKSEATSCVVM